MGDNVLRIRISPEHIFSLVPLAIDLTLHWPSEAPVYDKEFSFFSKQNVSSRDNFLIFFYM